MSGYTSYNLCKYSNFNKNVMKKYVLDPLSAANALTALMLKKADLAFYRMRRTKEREYRLANGTISGV